MALHHLYKKHWHVLNEINPEPWAMGPITVINVAKGGRFPKVGQNQQLAHFQDAVRGSIKDAHMIDGKVKITFYFWRVRDEYTTPKQRQIRKHEADATNMQKATEDALQGIFFENDRDVSDIRSVIVEQGPEVEPKIVICVEVWNGFDPDEIPPSVWAQIDAKPVASDNSWNGPAE